MPEDQKEERKPLLSRDSTTVIPSDGMVSSFASRATTREAAAAIAAHDAHRDTIRAKIDTLWGPAPEEEHSREDDANCIGNLLYTWIYYRIKDASRGELRGETRPIPVRFAETSYSLGRALSRAVQDLLDRRTCWDPLVGQTVRMKEDARSRGTLRWIGYAQQAKKPDRLLVGIEWKVAPAIYKDDRGALHDGTYRSEKLFEAAYGSSSLEDPNDVRFVHLHDGLMKNAKEADGISRKRYAKPESISIAKCLFSTFRGIIAIQIPFKLIGDAATLSGPVALEYFVKFLKKEDPTWEEGIIIALAIFFIGLIQSLMLQKFFHISLRAGLQFRLALQSLIFEKCFLLSSKASAVPEMNTGRIINMMSSDVERAFDFGWYLNYLWAAPVQAMIATALLYRLVGWAAFVGIGSVMIITPFQGLIVRKQHATRQKLTTATDNRVRATNELLAGIRIVKFMGWEPKFIESVSKLREIELGFLKQLQNYRVMAAFVSASAPMLMIASTFVSYHLSGHTMTPEVVFPAIALMNILRWPFIMIPSLMATLVSFLVSMRRIAKFLESENSPDAVHIIDEIDREIHSEEEQRRRDTVAAYATVLDQVTVTAYVPVKLLPIESSEYKGCVSRIKRLASCCTKKKAKSGDSSEAGKDGKKKDDSKDAKHQLQPKVLLQGTSMKVEKGKLCVIVGPTGSGKSTILETILGQLDITDGGVSRLGSVAYAPQQPWIMNDSVRNNITFFEEVDRAWLDEVIKSCQLTADLEALLDGEDTEIGEKGVNLSGGQKARISLARSVYCRRDLYLLDDPLSAVDAHVQQRLIDDCFLGLLKDKTRVLVTHQLHVLPKADTIVLLDASGAVAFSGTYRDYETFRKQHENDGMGSPLESFMKQGSSPLTGSTAREKSFLAAGSPPVANSPMVAAQHLESEGSSEDGDDFLDDEAANLQADEKLQGKPAGIVPDKAAPRELMTKEEKAVGSVPWKTYILYAKACGGVAAALLLLLLFTVTEVINVSQSVWLSFWSTGAYGLSRDRYLEIYIGIVGVAALGSPTRTFFGYNLMRRGSLTLHNRLLRSVIIAPMSFFDTTPLGRIINRFAKDIDQTDNELQMQYLFLFQVCFGLTGSLSVMLATQPLVLVPIVPCTFVYYRILVFYNSANRDIKRISSIAKSPLFALLSESLNGMKTILAYNTAPRILKKACGRIDTVFSAGYFQCCCNRWLGVRLELLGNLIVTSVAFAGVIGKMQSFGSQDVGLLSLGMTMSMTITSSLNFVVRQLSAVEADMNGVERIVYYIDSIPHEDHRDYGEDGKPHLLPGDQPEGESATIEFKNVGLRYREGLPLVLNNLSFKIADQEKIGVVGRTGSGKSTLMLAFLRIVDTCEGEILISGTPSDRLSLRDLRSRFSMIPQDPLLFEGTVRSNLDPFAETDSDVALWDALEQVGLKDRVAGDAGGLNAPVLDGGSNYSVGQRQLMCLARALLKRGASFILMDEATANVDHSADHAIQTAIKESFKHRTVITIAHRLHTVLHCDRIIVMDGGSVAETGSPVQMALNPASIFRSMIASHGPAQERKLLKQVKRISQQHLNS